MSAKKVGKKTVAPVVAPPPPVQQDQKFTIRAYRLKADTSLYSYSCRTEKEAEEPATILADLAARIDTAERCGFAPRVTVNEDYSTLTLYGWKKVGGKAPGG